MLDRDVITRDEVDLRLARFRALLEANELEAAVVVGTVEAHGPLTYLTAYAPMHQWATAIVHRSEPTVLLAGLGGARNLPYVSSLTWVSDLRYYPSVGEGASAVLGEWGVSGGVGLVGAGELPMGPSRALRRDLEGLRAVALDDAYARMRRAKRPRELAALRLAAGLRDRALVAGRKAAGEKGVTPAAIGFAVERAARLGGARDVRVLVYGEATGTWEAPGQGATGSGAGPCTVFLGVERCGYWAEALVRLDQHDGTATGGPEGAAAEAVVSAMAGAARPGVALSAVAEAGLGALEGAADLDDAARQAARAIGFGAAVGLGRERLVAVASGAPIEAGEVLALRCAIPAGAGVAAISRDLVVGHGGNRCLQEVSGA